MQCKLSVILSMCVAMGAVAPAQEPVVPTQAAAQDTSGKKQGAVGGKQIPMKKKKPKEVTPEETARINAEIKRQVDALPTQGAPMLDENSRQMLDPDGKPLFYPPPRPLLDKHGAPWLDENGKLLLQTPDNLGYDKDGKKLKAPKIKPPKRIPLKIVGGTLTVDGWTGKAALNYNIDDLKYLYVYVPGTGAIVISNLTFPGATEQKGAFDGKTLTVNVAEHTIQLTSEEQLLGKKPISAWVRVDSEFKMSSKFPLFGYGNLRRPPYEWPVSRENDRKRGIKPPELPKDLKQAPAPGTVAPQAPSAQTH